MNAKSAVTNQNLLEDLFGCDSNEEDEVQILKNKEYYIDKTNELLQDINLDNYYEILKIMLIKYKDLDEKKKEEEVVLLLYTFFVIIIIMNFIILLLLDY